MEIKAQIFRDGTSQGDRRQRALDPDYVAVDERTMADLIAFAQNFAKHLTYFNTQNQPDGDWSSFFAGDPDRIAALFTAIDEGRMEAVAELSKPHFALFLTFLKLLRHPQQQFRDLTKRRLDFYYRRVLQLTEKAAQPDHAHVVFALAPNHTEHLLPAGTLLSAGKDAQGNELNYVTDADLFVTQAQVASLKTLSIETVYIDLETIHRKDNRTNLGFENMLRWAVGRPNQGDPLPRPDWEIGDRPTFAIILELFESIKDLATDQVARDRQDYILNRLCFATLDEFKFCLDAHSRENHELINVVTDQQIIPPTELEWQQVYRLVEKAYRKKINQDRRDRLKQEHQNHANSDPNIAFLNLWRFAVGDPLAGNPLPFFREQIEVDLGDVLTEIQSDQPEAAERYIQEQLFLSVADFEKIMAVQRKVATDFNAPEWEEVYRLLERAQTKKRNFTYPDIGRTEMNAIHAQAIADAEPSKPLPVKRFHPFVAQPQNSVHAVQSLGVAIASPVLHLQEGNREITVTLACHSETFNRSQLETFQAQVESPFEIQISSEKGWLKIDPKQFSFDIGDFFLESPLKKYTAANLALIYQGISNSFISADQGQYLQFSDGSLYHIDTVLGDGSQVQVSSVGWVASSGQNLKYGSLDLNGGTNLNNPQIKTENNLSEITANNNSFIQEDINKFIVWSDGRIYQIKEFVNRSKVSVIYWGYLPITSSTQIKKYEQITFNLRGVELTTGLSLKKVVFTDSSEGEFTRDDVHNLVAWVNGEVYQITALAGDREVLVNTVGRIRRSPNPEAKVEQYSATGIYLNSLQFKVHLDETQPSIIPPFDADQLISFQTLDPVIKITFQTSDSRNSYYKIFKDLCLDKVNVQVAVADLKELQLRNDRSVLNPKSPFEPFGSQPSIGNSLYFAHPEIVTKPLDFLSIKVEWMGLPESFSTHYAAYSESGLVSPPLNNASFQANLELFLGRTWYPIAGRSLFDSPNNQLASTGQLDYDKIDFYNIPHHNYNSETENTIANDLLEQSHYFRLELIRPSFQHDLYPLVLNKVARSTEVSIQNLTVYSPYTPKIKSIAIAYKASAEINLLTDQVNPKSGQIFQLNPFGYIDLRQTVNPDEPLQQYYLLPQYTMAGDLYIGLRDLKPPQSLTLLFQMVSGSGNADLANPAITWSYLAGDRWQDLQTDEVLSDSTNNLLDSGIFQLVIPAQATSDNHLLPAGLHWLKATVTENALAIPDGLDVRTQAVTAAFFDQNNDPEHLNTPLMAESIQELVQRRSLIVKVTQPYSSFGGKRQEGDRTFYTRVSERLRHKQRALTRWDYEHLVLEQFPQIYKVKCLTQAEQSNNPSAAQVTLIVIPNLANTAPFLPLEPKAPQYLLREIESYLQARTSPFVKVIVKNPRYEQIKYRIAVRFHITSDQGYYIHKLNEELVRFLSPWAYEEQSDISFGSSIHSSAIIHFIETRPYVNYVANLKLIEQLNLSSNEDSPNKHRYQVNTTNLAQVKYVDSILVSAPEHIIDLITTSNYSAEEFEGIDYMAIGIDFVVT